ncbi:hypothetical protein Tco_0972067 [Tanacetum coccineum]
MPKLHNGRWFKGFVTNVATDDMHNDDHGSYDTLIQDQVVIGLTEVHSRRNAESQNGLKTPRITRKRCCCAKQAEKGTCKDPGGFLMQTSGMREPLEQVQCDTDDNVSANDIQHFEQFESISNTCAVETSDSNVIPDSPDMCDNDIQDDQNDVECDDKRVALANLIAR